MWFGTDSSNVPAIPLMLIEPMTEPLSPVDAHTEKDSLNLEEELHTHFGLAHTRWATHGEPSAVNSHPHRSDKDNGADALCIWFTHDFEVGGWRGVGGCFVFHCHVSVYMSLHSDSIAKTQPHAPPPVEMNTAVGVSDVPWLRSKIYCILKSAATGPYCR